MSINTAVHALCQEFPCPCTKHTSLTPEPFLVSDSFPIPTTAKPSLSPGVQKAPYQRQLQLNASSQSKSLLCFKLWHQKLGNNLILLCAGYKIDYWSFKTARSSCLKVSNSQTGRLHSTDVQLREESQHTHVTWCTWCLQYRFLSINALQWTWLLDTSGPKLGLFFKTELLANTSQLKF